MSFHWSSFQYILTFSQTNNKANLYILSKEFSDIKEKQMTIMSNENWNWRNVLKKKVATIGSQKIIVSKMGICEKLYVLSQNGAYWAHGLLPKAQIALQLFQL